MPPKFWTGYLRLSLVTCPVALQPATSESEKVRFHTLNRATGQRVVSRYIDSVTGKPVNDEKAAKGYEVGDDQFIVFDDEELSSVGLESTRTIDIDLFTETASVPWIYLDSPYFMTPSDPVGEEAFAVIREAMAATDTVGMSRVVLNRRERAVMLQPSGKGIIAWTLRFGDEVRKPGIYFGDIGSTEEDPALAKLADKLVAQKTAHWSADYMKDPVQEHLQKLIASKQSRSVRRGATDGKSKGNVVSIFDALKASLKETLDADKGGRAKKH